MKRPIDIEHANKWLIGFSIVSFVFAIAFFVSGLMPGGVGLLFAAILLLVPQIVKTIKRHRAESTYPTKNKKLQKQKEKFMETLIQKYPENKEYKGD